MDNDMKAGALSTMKGSAEKDKKFSKDKSKSPMHETNSGDTHSGAHGKTGAPHIHIHSHDAGHTMHVMHHDGMHEMHHFEQGDVNGMKDVMAEHMAGPAMGAGDAGAPAGGAGAPGDAGAAPEPQAAAA